MPLPAVGGAIAALGSIAFIIQTLITVVLLIVGVVQFIAGFDSAISFATDVKGPAGTIVTEMYSVLTSFLPFSLDSILNSLDSSLSSSGNSFTPQMTVSGLFNTLAFSETFNTVMICLLNALLFVLNVRFLRWSVQRLGLRFRGK